MGRFYINPRLKVEKILAERPSEAFISCLRDRIDQKQQQLQNQGIPEEFSQIVQTQAVEVFGVGRVIIATWEAYLEITQKTIQELGVNLKIIANKGSVMLLPEGINKASGLKALSEFINLSPDKIVGVGDENDCDFLQQCGYSVAVANALPEVKKSVNLVTKNSRGSGVEELIDQILNSDD